MNPIYLTEQRILTFSGKDAASFLQGQCTCNVLKLDRSSLGAFCNAKGRVISLFRIFKSEAAFYVILPKELADTVHQHLRKYVMRADVKIERLDESWHVLGLMRENPADFLSDQGFSTPETVDEVGISSKGFVIKIPSKSTERFIILSHWQPAELNDEALWRLEDIKAGIPTIAQATRESFVPQMLNLDMLGGISFDKGCYTGQEIVARAHYLGNLKRRLYFIEAQEGPPPSAGDSIYLGDQVAGTVITAQGFQMLAVLNIAQAEADLRLFQPEGVRLKVSID